jgi:hypothetical protein
MGVIQRIYGRSKFPRVFSLELFNRVGPLRVFQELAVAFQFALGVKGTPSLITVHSGSVGESIVFIIASCHSFNR